MKILKVSAPQQRGEEENKGRVAVGGFDSKSAFIMV